MTDAASRHALLTIAEMARADASAIAGGVPGERLMAAAGAAVAEAVRGGFPPAPVLVLCGPGNNGGDGFVAARLLRDAGWPVRLALLGERGRLKGDAALHAARWSGAVEALAPACLEGAGIVIDGLFGAGLARPLEGVARATLEALDERRLPVVAIDVPSGVHGDTGEVLGAAPRAALTVTFFRRKPGHLLLPGRLRCGRVTVADIGIPESVLGEIAPRTWANHPDLWRGAYPWPTLLDHKYRRGHGLVVGGARMTGAARLAARAALRGGAGLVTVACPREAEAIYQASLAALLTETFATLEDFRAVLESRRKSAYLLGPGNGMEGEGKARVLAALATRRPCVLDADALSVFADEPERLFAAIAGPCVITPHEGEFARIFTLSGDKLRRARAAAAKSKAVVLLKGGDSVVAAPDGRAVISENAPPELGTAGAGDVLSGIVLALLARGMAPFEAAMAATWLHGASAARVGPGLIADDLPEHLPQVLRELQRQEQEEHSGSP